MNVYIGMFLFAAVFPLLWLAIIFLISRLSGWASLASHYGTSQDLPKTHLKCRRILLRRIRFFPAQYGNIVTVSVDDEALYLSLIKIFGFGHEPLRVPFADVKAEKNTGLFKRSAYLTFARENGITVIMSMNNLLWIEGERGKPFPAP